MRSENSSTGAETQPTAEEAQAVAAITAEVSVPGRHLFRRIIAATADWSLAAAPLLVLLGVNANNPVVYAVGFAGLLVPLAYFAWSLGRGQTLGMRLVGIRLQRSDGIGRPGPRRATAQLTLSLLFIVSPFVTYVATFALVFTLVTPPDDWFYPDHPTIVIGVAAMAMVVAFAVMIRSIAIRVVRSGACGQTVIDRICRVRVVRGGTFPPSPRSRLRPKLRVPAMAVGVLLLVALVRFSATSSKVTVIYEVTGTTATACLVVDFSDPIPTCGISLPYTYTSTHDHGSSVGVYASAFGIGTVACSITVDGVVLASEPAAPHREGVLRVSCSGRTP